MPRYRNTRTGRVVHIPGEDKRISDLEKSKRWQRVEGHTAEPAGEPSAAEVRTWAKANGVQVPDKGRLSPEVIAQFKAALASQGPANQNPETE